MQNITRTVYNSYLQTCLLMDLPWTCMPNSTLNEKFAVQAGVYPATGVIPDLGYYCIGNGGHTFSVGSNDIAYPEPVQHQATDAALYDHLPFVLVPLTADLSPQQQAQYALRRTEVHGGITYAAYYLRRMTLPTSASMQLLNVSNGVTTSSAFTASNSNLNPTPPTLNSSGVNITSGNYASASAQLTLSLNAQDVANLLNVATILYGTPDAAIISEIGLCSGRDAPGTSTKPSLYRSARS